MNTKDYVIVGLSVALTLTLLAVIIVVARGKAQMEQPRYTKDEIMEVVNKEHDDGREVVPNLFGINAEVRRRILEAEKRKVPDYMIDAIAAEYDFQ